MIPNELTNRIGEVWQDAVDDDVSESFADIVEMSDSLTDIVDRITEAGWADESVALDADAMDELWTIATEGDESEGSGEPDAVELSAKTGEWKKLGGGASVYVVDGKITKGCPGLKGENVDDLIDEDEDSREEREARQQHAEAAGLKGHQVTAKQAQSLGKTRKVEALRSAKQAAKKYNVSTRDVIKQMPDAYRYLKDQLDVREVARRDARRKTGLNSHKIHQLEDAGKDHTNIARFDTIARSLAYENPELNWNPDDHGNGQLLWDLLKEDRESLPSQNAPEVAEMAAQMIASSKRSGLKRRDDQKHPGDTSEFSSDWDDWDQGAEDSYDIDQMGDAFEGDDTEGDGSGFDPSDFDQGPRQKVISHVSKHLKNIRDSANELQHFRNVARAHNVDGDEVIKSLGGVPFSLRLSMPSTSPALVRSSIAEAARTTDRNPTPAQKEAGNYRKGRFKLWGREFVIENPRGSIRSGVSKETGNPWATRMPNHYGYIRQTTSEADGDHIDVFIGPDIDSDLVFVIDQQTPDGEFDEHKVMVGWSDAGDAQQAYLDAYSSGWDGFAGIKPMSVAEFLDWISHGDTSVPMAGGCCDAD